MKQNSESRIELKEEQLDLGAFVKRFWNQRALILKTCLVFIFLGFIFLVITPKTYQAKTVFVSQEDNVDASGAFGNLASFAGINLGSISNDSQIPPKLYPGIVFSSPFLMDLLGASIYFNQQELTYKEYLEIRSEDFDEKIKDYSVRLPFRILKWVRSSSSNSGQELTRTSIVRLTDEDFELLEDLEDYIAINVNDKDGDISIVFKDKDPFVAAQMATFAKDLLQQKVIDYKTKKATELHGYLQSQFLQKQKELYDIQDSLAVFIEENKNLSSALQQNKRLRLESSLNMLSAVYNELGSQNEQAALQLKKQTPIFSIIEPVRVPNRKSSPRISIVMVISLVMGLVFSFGFILLNGPLRELRSFLKSK